MGSTHAELSDTSKAELRALLPPFAVVANPLDTTGAGIFEGDATTHCAAARVMALDPDVDVLVASYDAKNGWVEAAQSAPAFVDGVIAAHKAATEAGKPVVIISLTTGNVDALAREYLEENSVACLMGLQPAMRAISLLLVGGRRPEFGELAGSQIAEFRPRTSSVGSVAGRVPSPLASGRGCNFPLPPPCNVLKAPGFAGGSRSRRQTRWPLSPPPGALAIP